MLTPLRWNQSKLIAPSQVGTVQNRKKLGRDRRLKATYSFLGCGCCCCCATCWRGSGVSYTSVGASLFFSLWVARASHARAMSVVPAPAGTESVTCAERFQSFDPTSGTYLGRDGRRHPCS